MTDESRMRSRNAWTEKSREIREKAQYLCEVCRDRGLITFDNLEVHHIVKIREDSSLFLDDSNLICLCQEHHKQAEIGILGREYLKTLADARDRR